MLYVILSAALAVLLLVSLILALVLWRYGVFAPSQPGRQPAAPTASDPAVTINDATEEGCILQIKSRTDNVLDGKPLQVTGGNVNPAAGYLTVTDSPALQPRGAVTVCAWFNGRSFQNPMTIAGRAVNGPPWRFPFLSWLVRINTSDIIEIGVGDGQTYVPSGWNVPALVPGRWYHVAMTYDGQTKALFLNGVRIRSLATGGPGGAGAIGYTPERMILIGADESEAPVGDVFEGAINDVRIYNRALSEEEIQAQFARWADAAR